MKLYHFTGREHLAGIRAEGLRPQPVAVPVGPDRLVQGRAYSWLSTSPDWTSQEWGLRPLVFPGRHRCDRTELRLTFSIPKAHREAFMPWLPIAQELLELGPEGLDAQQWIDSFVEYPGAEFWIVTTERVKPAWLREVVERPADVEVQPERYYPGLRAVQP